MNKKMTMLLIAAVVTILPAVAVADVLITGTATLEGTAHGGIFEIQAGSNYLNANAQGSIVWTGDSNGPTMGTIDLQGIMNQTTMMINVLDLNISASAPVTGTLNISVSSSTLPVGAMMYISDSAFTGFFTSAGTIQTVNLATGGYAVFTVGPSSTLYFAFLLPAGAYAETSAVLTGVYEA